MILESCPVCGYALSIVSHECRHCPTASPLQGWLAQWDARLLAVSGLLAVLGVVLYRHFCG